LKTDPTFWIIARASGLSAYGLMTMSVVVGLIVKSRPLRALKASTVTDVHRVFTSLALAAIAVHGTALALDTKIPFSVKQLVVPGISPYRPIWTGTGIVVAELMLLIYLSFSARRWIGTKNWRRLHYLTFGLFAGATVHGVMTGTDSGRQWTLLIYVTAIGLVVSLTSWRVLAPPAEPSRRRTAAAR
jgi:methionine sulfoxide reductase heme-binding subunit